MPFSQIILPSPSPTVQKTRGMVRGGRREEGSGWGTRVYLWRIHVDIWQNQYNIVNNKIKLKKKKIKKEKKYYSMSIKAIKRNKKELCIN